MSDELSFALRELAAARATRPVVDGAGIRVRAMRRRRRRRTAVTLGAGAVAVVLLGLVLNLGGNPDQHPPGHRIPPAAQSSGTTPPTTATPLPVSGTLDPRRHTLTVDGRVLPVLSKFDGRTRFAGPLTVVAKYASRGLPVEVPAKGAMKVDVPHVVELRDARDQPFYVGTFTKPLALGDFVTTSDWIALDEKDAAWFHATARVGDAIAVTGEGEAGAGSS